MWKKLVPVAAIWAGACASELDPDGLGLECTSRAQCAPGFVCDTERNRCLRPSELDAGLEPDTEVDDAGPGDDAVDVVVIESDASCESPVVYYQDGDGDGFGRDDVITHLCEPPGAGWSETGGDCNDTVAETFPGQTAFFDAGYPLGSGGVSFDYDCSGTEDADGSQPSEAPDCEALGSCAGNGFVPTPRSGAGVDPLCGSTTLVDCVVELLTCKNMVSTATEPKRCH